LSDRVRGRLSARVLSADGYVENTTRNSGEPSRDDYGVRGQLAFDVTVRNPFDREETAVVRLVVPAGWDRPAAQDVALAPLGEAVARCAVAAGGAAARRARVAADVTVGETPFGQQAEALVDVA
jgi:hypothetical protein